MLYHAGPDSVGACTCLQDKCITRTSGRQVLASDGETAVQDGQQQQYVSWDSLRR